MLHWSSEFSPINVFIDLNVIMIIIIMREIWQSRKSPSIQNPIAFTSLSRLHWPQPRSSSHRVLLSFEKNVSKNRNSLQFHIALSILKRCKRAAAIRKPRGTSFPRERYIFRRNLQKKLPQQFFLLLTHSNDGPQYVTQQYVRIVRIIQNILWKYNSQSLVKCHYLVGRCQSFAKMW